MTNKPGVQDKFNSNDWNIGKIFWGLLFILIGCLSLASNFGYININFANLWRLWPLLIVAAGLSILSIRNVAGRIIAITLALATLAAVTWVMIGNFPNSPLHTYDVVVQKASDKVKQAEVNIKAGASSLQVGTVAGNSIVKSRLQSNVATQSKTSNLLGDNQQITLSMSTKGTDKWITGDTRNIWNIDLTKNIPLTLNIDTGASSSDIDMSDAFLRLLSIKTGASSVTIKLGDKLDITNLNIESGVSSILLKVPRNSGVQLLLDNGLTSNNLANLVKVGDNRYETPGYSQNKKQVIINSKIGLSSFTIEKY